MTTPIPDNKRRSLKIVGAVFLLLIICLVLALIGIGAFPVSPQKNPVSQNVSPTLTSQSIIPPSGASGTLVPVTIWGTNFTFGPSPSVWLAKAGEPDIIATGVMVISKTQLTCTFPLPASYTTAGQWDVFVKNPDEQSGSKVGMFMVENKISPPMTWNWSGSTEGWTGWQYTTTCTGSATESCTEYGPVLETGYGVYGSKLTPAGGSSTKSTVKKTFIAASGERWNTLTFSGLLSPSAEDSYSRSMTINVNGLNVYSATAEEDPVINGRQFTLTKTFYPASVVTVMITTKQDPIIGTDHNTLQFNALTLQ